jgi:hypothetical protein
MVVQEDFRQRAFSGPCPLVILVLPNNSKGSGKLFRARMAYKRRSTTEPGQNMAIGGAGRIVLQASGTFHRGCWLARKESTFSIAVRQLAAPGLTEPLNAASILRRTGLSPASHRNVPRTHCP